MKLAETLQPLGRALYASNRGSARGGSAAAVRPT